MALVVALAINNGFRNTLQRNLLGATAHVTVLEKEPGYGIANWRELAAKLRRLPHVTGATPSLYGSVFLAAPLQSDGAVLKGHPDRFRPAVRRPGAIHETGLAGGSQEALPATPASCSAPGSPRGPGCW